MANTTLQVILEAKDKTGAAFDNLNKKLDKTGVISAQTAKNLKIIGIAGAGLAIGIGKKAVDAAVDFNASMANVATLLDTTTEDMNKMKKEVLDMSKKTPVAVEELTEALYDVRSAGIGASGAMEVLNASAKLAVAGLGTTKEATNVLTSAINAFGLDSAKANKYADVFFKAVKAGKTTVAELAQGFGQVAPLANSLGVQFEELMAITSAMTTSGLQASVAYTQQRAVMSNLLKPTREMQDLFDKLNITNIKSQIENEGLTQTIIKLAGATDGNNQMLAKAFGSVEGLNAVMMLLGDTGIKTTEIFNDMTKGADALTLAYEGQTKEAKAQFQLLKNQLGAQMIALGNKIIPVLLRAIEDGMLILGEWRDAFMDVADAIGTVIFKAQQATEAVSNWFKKLRESTGPTFGEVFSGQWRGESNIKGLPFFQKGGVVPGPVGKPRMVVAHGGETILPTQGAVGNTFNFDFSGANIVDKNKFIKDIIDAVNRSGQLALLGAQ